MKVFLDVPKGEKTHLKAYGRNVSTGSLTTKEVSLKPGGKGQTINLDEGSRLILEIGEPYDPASDEPAEPADDKKR